MSREKNAKMFIAGLATALSMIPSIAFADQKDDDFKTINTQIQNARSITEIPSIVNNLENWVLQYCEGDPAKSPRTATDPACLAEDFGKFVRLRVALKAKVPANIAHPEDKKFGDKKFKDWLDNLDKIVVTSPLKTYIDAFKKWPKAPLAGPDPVIVIVGKTKDVSDKAFKMQDIRSLISKFEVGIETKEKDNEEPGNVKPQTALYGLVYSNCLDHLQIIQHPKSCPNAVAFEFRDEDGLFQSCMTRLKAAGYDCSNHHCTNLHDLPSTKIGLPDEGNAAVEIKLVHRNPNLAKDSVQCESLERPVVHKTHARVEEEKKQEEREEHNRQVAHYTRQMESCDQSKSELDQALDANKKLYESFRAIDETAFNKNQKEIQAKNLKLLMNRVRAISSGKSIEEIEDVHQDLMNWAHSHPGDTQQVVEALVNIAQGFRSAPNAESNLAAWTHALATISDAQSLVDSQPSKVRIATRTSLQYSLDEIKMGRVLALCASSMNQNPNACQVAYMPLLQENLKKFQKVASNRSASEAERRHVVGLLQATQNIPGRVSQIQHENHLREQQMWMLAQQQQMQQQPHQQNHMQGQNQFNPMMQQQNQNHNQIHNQVLPMGSVQNGMFFPQGQMGPMGSPMNNMMGPQMMNPSYMNMNMMNPSYMNMNMMNQPYGSSGYGGGFHY